MALDKMISVMRGLDDFVEKPDHEVLDLFRSKTYRLKSLITSIYYFFTNLLEHGIDSSAPSAIQKRCSYFLTDLERVVGDLEKQGAAVIALTERFETDKVDVLKDCIKSLQQHDAQVMRVELQVVRSISEICEARQSRHNDKLPSLFISLKKTIETADLQCLGVLQHLSVKLDVFNDSTAARSLPNLDILSMETAECVIEESKSCLSSFIQSQLTCH